MAASRRWPIARGSVLGFLIGIIPGSAHIISSFVSYALERKLSRQPEQFGKGAVAGVAGPEAANNAASTGAFVPMLALGLPTGPVIAVLMAALLIHGVPPGPNLVNDHPNVFWGFVASMYVGNLMLLLLNLPLVGVFVNLLRIPYAYLYPLIIMFCVIGVYEVNHSIVDVWIMLIFGVVGYALKKFGFDPAPLVLGLVIAPIFEMSLRQSLIMSDGTWGIFLERPIALVLLLISAALLALAAISAVTRDWRGKLAEVEARKSSCRSRGRGTTSIEAGRRRQATMKYLGTVRRTSRLWRRTASCSTSPAALPGRRCDATMTVVGVGADSDTLNLTAGRGGGIEYAFSPELRPSGPKICTSISRKKSTTVNIGGFAFTDDADKNLNIVRVALNYKMR